MNVDIEVDERVQKAVDYLSSVDYQEYVASRLNEPGNTTEKVDICKSLELGIEMMSRDGNAKKFLDSMI